MTRLAGSFALLILLSVISLAQVDTTRKNVIVPATVLAKEDKSLKFNLNDEGSHWFQMTLLNQAWARFNESNPGTMMNNEAAPETFDIGLRRTRIQLYGQITDRTFIYFQWGLNNVNSQAMLAGTNNRKVQAFILNRPRLAKRNEDV